MAPAFTCRLSIMAAAVVAVVGLSAPPAGAQPVLEDLGFIMDGDPSDGAGFDDWEALFNNNISVGDTRPIRDGSGALCTFVAGEFIVDTADRVAWKGGTKDFEDFSEWWNRAGGASSKSDIQNAGVAAWSCDVLNTPADPTDDHLILQCFGDRLATSGDTFMGCWGLQNELKFDGNRFMGDGHERFDVLAVSNFPGNVKPDEAITEEIAVWIWDPVVDGIKGTLKEEKAFGEAVCDGLSPLTDLACSIINEGGEPVPYPYTSSNSDFVPGQYPRAAFDEMTINLTASTGDPDFCLATTIVETRQSSSPSSLLDQIVLGQSATCGLIVTVECDGLGVPDFVNNTFDYLIKGTVATTAGTVDDIKIERLLPATDPLTVINSDVDGVNVTPKDWRPGGVSHAFSSSENPVTVQVRATDPDGDFTTATSTTVECPANEPDGQVEIKKDCIACIEDANDHLAVLVKAAGEVSHTGDGENGFVTPITGFDIVDVTDPENPVIIAQFPGDFPNGAGDPAQNGKLDPGETVSYAYEYNPEDIPGGGSSSNAAVTFSDTVELQNITLQFGGGVEENSITEATATCPLCPVESGLPFGLTCVPQI